jgi:signal peptidase
MALIVVFPFYWMIISSLKTLPEYERLKPTFFPTEIYWQNYTNAFEKANMGRLFMNTLYVGVVSTLLSLIIVIALLLVGVRALGVKPYTVLSGSMEPNYHVGSIVYVKKVDPFSLKEKNVITYVIGNGTVVTHRIVEVIYDDEENPTQVSFRTKGDNNNTEDGGEPVPASNVLGKVVFTIPLLGYVANLVQNPVGRVMTVCVCVCIAILFFLPDLLDKWLKEDGEEEKET